MKSNLMIRIVLNVFILDITLALTNKSYTNNEKCVINKLYNNTTKLKCTQDNHKSIYFKEKIYFETNKENNTIFEENIIAHESKPNFEKNCITVTNNKINKNKNIFLTTNISNQTNTHPSLTTENSLDSKKAHTSLSGEESEPMYKEYTLKELKDMAKEGNVHEPEYIDEDPPGNSSEVARGEAILAKAEDLVEHILDFGEHLFNIFKHLPNKGGDLLIKDFLQYNEDLENLLNVAKSNKKYTNEAVSDYLETNQPYPYIPQTEYCQEKLKQDFNWTNVDYEFFLKIYNNTTQLYCDLQDFHNSLPK